MRRFQSILYISRGTADESNALKQALSLARHNAAALHAVVICPLLPGDLGEYEADYKTSLAERIRASITNAQAALGMSQEEVHATVEVDCGDTSAVRIVRRILRNAHDLLVKQAEPTDRRAGFQALDMQLLRLCPCPTWLCRPIGRSRTEIRVAVAVNPQSVEPVDRDLALQLLRLARSLADTYSGELSIVSCWDYKFEEDLRRSPWTKVSEDVIRRRVITAERDHRAAFETLIQESEIAGPVREHHTRGSPERAIAQLADSLAVDILVMGTVGRTGIPGFVIGNTAESVLREIRCSLMALKPNGFVSPVRAYG
jgi:nucleotide-binding universal stress UspA family protein